MKSSFRYIYLFFLLLPYSPATYTQNAWVDSVKNTAATQKADTNLVNSLLILSDVYRFTNPDSALFYGQKALSLATVLKSDDRIFWSIVAVNSALYVLGNYALELDYAYKAIPYAKKINTPYAIGFSNGMLCDSYFNLGEYNTSLRYWRIVMRLCEQTLPGELYSIYGNSARIFSALKQYDSALIYARKSIDAMKHNPVLNIENSDGKFARSNIFIALGDAFEGNAINDSALFYYQASLPFTEDVHMDINRVDAFNGIARLYNKTKRFDSAITYANKVLSEKVTKTYPQGFLKAANLLALVYESQKNADSSLKYLHIAISLRDSLFNREKLNAFQNVILKEEEKRRDLEATKSKLQRQYLTYFLIALLTIAITISSVVIRNRRIKQLQNIRNNIADDLHDDIGSALSSISIMNELARIKSPEASSLLTSIGETTVAIQENMSDIVWTIKSGNDRFENVLQRMNQFASEISDAKNIELDFASDVSLYAAKLTMEQRKNFYLFFKEVINNAAKYSEAKKISVNIAQKSQEVEMCIRDNGKGFDTNTISGGNGMNTLKKRAAELRAIFTIQSSMNEGTLVRLKFKIT